MFTSLLFHLLQLEKGLPLTFLYNLPWTFSIEYDYKEWTFSCPVIMASHRRNKLQIIYKDQSRQLHQNTTQKFVTLIKNISRNFQLHAKSP